jgi:hypothetical protein
VLVTGSGPYYAPLAEMDFVEAARDLDQHLWLPMHVARAATGRVRPGGTLLLVGGTGGRRRGVGLCLIGALTAALPALVAALAVHIMTNTALTGATYDVDGGQQLV